MPRTRPPYPPEFRARMVELVRSGRTAEELSREFEPTAATIRKSPVEARRAIFDFIEGFYNPRRRHSALEYHSPVSYERAHAAA